MPAYLKGPVRSIGIQEYLCAAMGLHTQRGQFMRLFTKVNNHYFNRVAKNFKHEKFIWDQADSYSLRKRNAKKCRNYQNPTTFKGAR